MTPRLPAARRPVRALLPLTLALVAALAGSGCAVAPQPLQPEAMADLHQQALTELAARQSVPTEPLTLEAAIARALKYNLEMRSRLLEQALASGQLEAGRYDMLPRLLASAGYTSRDNDATRRSADPANPGQFSTTTPYLSADRQHGTWDLGLSWNLMDFGASYYSARQNADRLLVAGERRRKAMHTLIQNVRTAWWRAQAAQALAEPLKATLAEAEGALGDARALAQQRVRAPGEALRYQRNLLENLRLLEGLERELASARIELASLMGLNAATKLVLATPPSAAPAPLALGIEQLEASALAHNADLREAQYNGRIAAADTRKALLRLLPGITFDAGIKHDNDRFLVNQQWQEAGLRVSFNLFNLLSGPAQLRAARSNEAVAQANRMALQMTVLTQVHLAWHQQEDALRQFHRADALNTVDAELARIATGQEQSQMAGRLERISASVSSILSTTRRYQAMARVHESASRLQALMGLQPELGAVDEADLPTLEQAVRQSLDRWTTAAAATGAL